MEIIPHRHPFLLIDTIEELVPGLRAVGKKCVTFDEPYFAGHFPGEPVMPGVLIIEALAQTGAVAMLCQDEFKGKPHILQESAMQNLRKGGSGGCTCFRDRNHKSKGTDWNWKGNCNSRWKIAATAELTFAIGSGE